MKFYEFNKKNLPTLRKILNKEFESISKKYNIKIELGNVKFDQHEFTSKTTFTIIESNDSKSIEQKMFEKNIKYFYPLEPSDYNKQFKYNNDLFTIIGVDRKKRKRPIVLKIQNGNLVDATIDFVTRNLKK